eukprot:197804-Chlamydomonas_euryale.AAC.2
MGSCAAAPGSAAFPLLLTPLPFSPSPPSPSHPTLYCALRWVCRPGTWALVQQRLAALPSSIKHVVVVAAVPMVYPKIPLVESALMHLTGQGRMAKVWGGHACVRGCEESEGLVDSTQMHRACPPLSPGPPS